MLHNLKIRKEFADAVLYGDKSFEIRYNDRGYQKSDVIKFKVVDNSDFSCSHPLNDYMFEITYVLSGYGLKENYVVLAIKKCN